ncbi:Hypothetical predicted protein [Lecanosticta acicola]|uniref:Ino eighty subunit 1 n=1 Tax=Lecanosticta acicola TaxID=111012 RepID=A0AAI8YT46_9PEZI|nr:Hypothetical predicted protein [Lecanosticta acicola]
MASLSRILAPDPDPSQAPPSPSPAATPTRPPPPAPPVERPSAMPPRKKAQEPVDDDAVSTPKADASKGPDEGDETTYTSTTTSTRRNANGNTSTVYSGNKIRHLKKEDGIPLWRKDIQYDFLKLVFDDQTKCFTKYSDRSKGHTFADIYIDAMAKSSKCSKILKEKLLQDQDGAISMAMVCLLVNVGRMNTTLNFFPEMRAQLRTYHSIPALQAHQDPNAYKQLQDAPRLKSILKGATEDEPQPSTMEDIKATAIPRTNPVNLIFVMSQYAPKVSEVHFQPPRDFFDLVMKSDISSESRAKAFLWLIWWYLESDFSYEDSQRNPFGPGIYGEDEEGTTGTLPLRVPTLQSLTEEEAALENVDTEDEQHFGEVKRKERIAILASEPSPAMTALKRARKEKGLTTGHNAQPSDDEGSEAGYQKTIPTSVGRSGLQHETGSEYTRSPSPVAPRGFQAVNAKPVGDMRINNLLNSDDVGPDMSPSHGPTPAAPPVKKGPGRGNWRRNKKPEAAAPARSSQDGSHHVPLLPNTGQISFVNDGPAQMQVPQSSPNQPSTISFAAPNTHDHIPTPSYQAQKRHRGVTQHQSAVNQHRKMQIDYTLDKRIRKEHIRARDKREAEGAIIRAWKRIRSMPPDYDSEEEGIKIRKVKDRVNGNDDDWRVTKGNKENEDFMDVDSWRRPRVLFAGYVRMNQEPSDVGEEAKTLAQSFRRASRRLERWQSSAHPGNIVERRREREAAGVMRSRRRSMPSMDRDGLEVVENVIPLRGGVKRPRGGGRKSTGQSHASHQATKAQTEAEPYEEDGGAELDEEDRELLGEVDADESEEDEDEDMDD